MSHASRPTAHPGIDAATRRWLVAVGAALALALAAIVWVQQRQITLLSDSVRYEGDNLAWSFFQLESEYQQLHHQLHELHHQTEHRPVGPDQAEALRQRFELFASRLPRVGLERTDRFVHFDSAHAAALARIDGYIRQHDALLGESSQQVLSAEALAEAAADLSALGELVHDMSLRANAVIAEQLGRRNDTVREHTRLGIGLTAFQSLLTLLFAGLTARQFRALRERRETLERLAVDLTDAREDAESASQAKTAFLANMSHELRTPFNGMLGMLALLEGSRLDAEQADHVRTARESANHLLELLNDILDISKLESGRLDIAPHPIDLHRLVAEVHALMALSATTKGLSLDVSVAPDVPRHVVADHKRVKQILFNLMSNAVKFTSQGQVRLWVQAAPLVAGRGRPLRFTVQDSGPGIDAAMQERLFKRFSQGDASTSRRFGGTGLGLEISRSLARLMGGDITVRSVPGEGSSFMLDLVLPEAEAPPPAAADTLHGAQPRGGGAPLDLVVADDHPTNRKFMHILLGRLGHRVRLAEDGAQVLKLVAERVPDLVFMDLHMPELDGLDATRALRALPAPAGQVPVVALTADVFPETRARVQAVGMNSFLSKPVRPDDIDALLVTLFAERAHPALAPDESPAMSAAPSPAAAPAPAPSPAPAPPSPLSPAAAAAPAQAPMQKPAQRPAPAPAAPAPPRRFRSTDVAEHLDMGVIGEVCVGITLMGYRGLLGDFLTADGESLSQLLAALQQHDSAALQARAHAVKGVAASLGLRALRQLAFDIEQHGAGYDAHTCHAQAQTLRERVDLARALCQRMGFL